MDLGISGLNALILGGTKGLGLSCARALVQAGVHVVLNGRDEPGGQAAAAELGNGTGFIAGDVSDPASRRQIFKGARARLGPIAILVTNSGGPPPGPLETHDHAVWLKALENNMLAAIDFASMALPDMREAGFGRIVNITSAAVKAPIDVLGLSNGARAGLTGFVAGIARKTVRHNVTINGLLPGPFNTDRIRKVAAGQAQATGASIEDIMTKRARENPAGRFGDPEEFGAACAFLCSTKAGFITGQNILLDGGAYPGTL